MCQLLLICRTEELVSQLDYAKTQTQRFGAYLESQVELLERAAYLRDECVHALTLLEADQDVRGAFSCFRGDVRHVVLLWKFLQHLI